MNLEPANGKARWRTLYDMVTETAVGEILTYAQAIRECNAPGRAAVQAAMHRANLELGRDGRNTVDVVANIGWRVLKPNEMVPVVHRKRVKGERADDRAAATANAALTRVSEMDPDKREDLYHERRVLARKAEVNGRRRRETRLLADTVAEMESNAPKRLRG